MQEGMCFFFEKQPVKHENPYIYELLKKTCYLE